jgi:hypothetical protein
MPVITSAIERALFFTLNQGPAPLLDLLGAQAFKAVAVALRLGVFQAMEGKGATAASLAAKIGADALALATLLDALAGLGYLRKTGDRYAATAMTRRWMLRSSPQCVADMFPSFEDMMRRWDYLDETIRRGIPSTLGYQWYDARPGSWRRYHEGLRAVARIVGPEIASKVKLPREAHRLLDLGGGHGTYSVCFCRRHPRLHATIFDWEHAREVADETIGAAEMGARVSFRAGDFLKDDIGAGYEAVLVFNVIRIFQPGEAVDFLRKAGGALSRDGIVIVMDQLAEGAMTPFAAANAALINLELINSIKGRIHSARDVSGFLRSAGFTQVHSIGLLRSPGFKLVVGRKP